MKDKTGHSVGKNDTVQTQMARPPTTPKTESRRRHENKKGRENHFSPARRS